MELFFIGFFIPYAIFLFYYISLLRDDAIYTKNVLNNLNRTKNVLFSPKEEIDIRSRPVKVSISRLNKKKD